MRLRRMLDGWNVTNGFKTARRADGLLHALDSLDLDLDLDLLLPLFGIKISLLIWLSNWRLFLPFSLFVVMVVVVDALHLLLPLPLPQHHHYSINMDIFLNISSNSWPYFKDFLLLLHMVAVNHYHWLLQLYVLLFIRFHKCCLTVIIV